GPRPRPPPGVPAAVPHPPRGTLPPAAAGRLAPPGGAGVGAWGADTGAPVARLRHPAVPLGARRWPRLAGAPRRFGSGRRGRGRQGAVLAAPPDGAGAARAPAAAGGRRQPRAHRARPDPARVTAFRGGRASMPIVFVTRVVGSIMMMRRGGFPA